MSQSETWDALCLAAEWRSIGREVEADRVMPEPEAKWMMRLNRCQISEPAIKRVWRTAIGVEITTLDARFARWTPLDYSQEKRGDRTSPFSGIDRSVAVESLANPADAVRVAQAPWTDGMATRSDMADAFLYGAQHLWNQSSRAGKPYHYIDEAQRLDYRRAGRVLDGLSDRGLPRRNLTAALTALPGYRDPR